VLVDVEGWTPEVDDKGVTRPAPESATFTFRGEAKPTPVPDTPEVATAGTSDQADG
jgi:ATP-dependent Clp protease ATP-binding subunit ClpC